MKMMTKISLKRKKMPKEEDLRLIVAFYEGVEITKCAVGQFSLKTLPIGRPLYEIGRTTPSMIYPSGKSMVNANASILIPDGKKVRFTMEMQRIDWMDLMYKLLINNEDAGTFYLLAHDKPIDVDNNILIEKCIFREIAL